MPHIDTLKFYEDLIKSGNNELEAKAHIYNINNALTDLVTKDDLHKELKDMENRIDLKFNNIGLEINHIKTVGWALFVLVVIPTWGPMLKSFFLG